jgi:diguanylate cyclase (GGDEF)-like protein/PAS domain S-box-containing protein
MLRTAARFLSNIPFFARVAMLAVCFIAPLSLGVAVESLGTAREAQLVRLESLGCSALGHAYAMLRALDHFRRSPDAAGARRIDRAFGAMPQAEIGVAPAEWRAVVRTKSGAGSDPVALQRAEDAVATYMIVLSDRSNLSYDANAAIVDLDDALAYRLPGVAERFGLAAQPAGVIALTKLAATAGDRLDFADQDLQSALAEQSSFNAVLRSPVVRADRAGRRYLALLEDVAAHPGRPAPRARIAAALGDALGGVDALFIAGNRELQVQLALKSAAVGARRRAFVALALCSLLAIFGILCLIAATIARRDRRELSRAQDRAARLQAELARKQAEDALQLNEARFQAVFTGSPLPIVLADLAGRVVECNRAYLQLVGAAARPAARRSVFDAFAEANELRRAFAVLENVEKELQSVEVRGHALRGNQPWFEGVVSLVRDARGVPSYCAVMLQDITGRKEREHRLEYDATHDRLTGLPNRADLIEAVQRAVAEPSTGPPRFAFVFADLDDFKVVNDSLGHGAGDACLRAVASRLTGYAREGDVVARYGGDEFAMLLVDPQSIADARVTVERVHCEFALPMVLEDNPVTVTLSTGVVVDDGAYCEVATVIADADAAMYRAKGLRRAAALA